MTKDELRKIYLAKRKALSEEERMSLSKQLCDLFFSTIDLSSTKVVHIYIPIESKQEPDTWLIIDRIQKDFPLIRISIPKIQNEAMESFYFEGLHQLEKNNWGILEPKLGVPTPINEIDLVIVPLLAFDKLGHRVGYGKGFYDRFLKDCRSDCRKIGLSLFQPEEKIEDTDHLDVPLGMAFTPKEVFQF
jgi:5-formyltetrahydrofolate cyclo-ligase